MIQYLIAGLVGGAVAMAQKPKKKGRRKYAEGGILSPLGKSTMMEAVGKSGGGPFYVKAWAFGQEAIERVVQNPQEVPLAVEKLVNEFPNRIISIQENTRKFIYTGNAEWHMELDSYAEGGKTREVKVYSIEELDDSGSYPTPRDRALDKVREGVFMFDWWDGIYDDAKNVGVTISGFDLGRGRSIDVELDDSPEDVCQAIIDEHGDADEEPRIILAELMRLNESIDEAYDSEDEEDSNGTSLYDLEDQKESVEEDLITYLKQYYYTMLQREYDYMNEDDYLIEYAEANAMEFDKDGYVFRYAKGGRTKRMKKGGKVYESFDEMKKDYDRYDIQDAFEDYVYDRISHEERQKIRQDWNDMDDYVEWESYLLKRVNEKSYAKGGRVSTYDYKVGGNPQKPFAVLGRKDGMVMYHTSRASVKDSADKAEELLENGYDEVLIAQP